MAADHLVVGIDVGTTKICTLIAAITPEDQVEVVGVGISTSKGLRRGVVVNVEEAVDAIRSSVSRAEQQSGFQVKGAFVGISGAHIASMNSRGVVAVHRHDGLITAEDLHRAMEAARVVHIPSDRDVIHVLPRFFIVDGQEGVRNPEGMLGHRLEVETNIVTGARTSVQNLLRCVEKAGIVIDSMVLQPLAAGEAVLTDAEKELGVILLDIGGGTTDTAIFTEGSICHASVIPVGGNNLSNDLAIGLRTPFAAAEEIKMRHGSALASKEEDNKTVEVASFADSTGRPVSRRLVSEIIEMRLAETFELVVDQITRAGYSPCLPAGVVLAGGTAQLKGIKDLASEIFQAPVRIGRPDTAIGLVDSVSTPAYAASLGLLRCGRSQVEEGQGGVSGGIGGIYQSIVNWFRSFFP